MKSTLTKTDVAVGESIMIKQNVAFWGNIIGDIVAVYDDGLAVDTRREEMPSIMFFNYDEVEK